MRAPAIVGIVVVLLAALGFWWYYGQTPSAPAVNEQGSTTSAGTSDNTQNAQLSATSAPMSATITYAEGGFSPATVTVARGGTVTFINASGGNMWVAVDAHPTHTQYDSTSRSEHCAAGYAGPVPFDQCKSGESYSFTFDKAGSFDYHNHAAAQFAGTIVVE